MCLATESFCNSTEATRESEGGKDPLIHLFFPCSVLNEISRIFSCWKYPSEATSRIREGSCVGAQRAASNGANRSNKARGQLPLWRQRRGDSHRAVSKNSQSIDPLPLCVQLQNLSAVFSLTVPGGGHTRTSPHPLPSTRQTPIHPVTDCLPECCCSRCLHGRVLPLPDFQADLNSTSVVLLQKTNTLMFLVFRKAWSSFAEAHISAFTLCVNGAQKERQPRTTDAKRERANKREGRAVAEYILSFTLH